MLPRIWNSLRHCNCFLPCKNRRAMLEASLNPLIYCSTTIQPWVQVENKLPSGNKNEDDLKDSSYSSSSSVTANAASQHKRSKSASDKNLDSSKSEVFQSVKPDAPQVQGTTVSQQETHDRPVKNVSDHRASLENDIEMLQMCLLHERKMRNMLERAMGRASSTLSPGHRHFTAQTRELITEIEILEQEVANREKHVLSLYRSIFDQSASKTSSERNSGSISPAHDKNEARKHPSIISSSFCSSRKFPLQHFQVMATIREQGKKSSTKPCKTRYNSLCSSKMDVVMDNFFHNGTKSQNGAAASKTKVGSHTLRDHLYHRPCELSQQLVRSMAAIYHWLHVSSSKRSKTKGCPSFSRSLMDVFVPRSTVRGEQSWSCKSLLQISRIQMEKNQFSRASYDINNYRSLVELLERVDVTRMEGSTKLAFWINVYNSLVMHTHLAYGIPRTSMRRMTLFHKASYNIGGHMVSANSIEHFILCFRTPRIGRWFEPILSTALRIKSGEGQLLRQRFGISECQPIVCFALCSGARSDPVLKVYTAKNVKEDLEMATKEFLQANVVVSKSKKVMLPKVVERYAKEASLTNEGLLDWVCKNVDKKLHDAVAKCIHSKSRGKTSQIIEWVPYNARFRYVFSRDLTDKPWCV